MNKAKVLHFLKEHSTTIIFSCGFIFDMIILPDIDEAFGRNIGGLYLFLIATLIIFREWIISRNKASIWEGRFYSIASFGVAYFSGSSLSFIFIYAIRDADILASWPILLIIAICIYANEFVNTHGFRLTTDVGVLFFAFLFYVIFHLPVILRVQNDKIFVLSLLIVAFVSYIYTKILKNFSESARHEYPRFFSLSVGLPMFIGLLYFLNVMPAVPLSIKNSGVYHYVGRQGNDFLAQEEIIDKSFLSSLKTTKYNLTPKDNGIYFFSSVSAPASLTAPISHVWQYYDRENGGWVTDLVVPFSIEGGREDGYRAFSMNGSVKEGLWRVVVKVGGNRIVGVKRFYIEKSEVVNLREVKI